MSIRFFIWHSPATFLILRNPISFTSQEKTEWYQCLVARLMNIDYNRLKTVSSDPDPDQIWSNQDQSKPRQSPDSQDQSQAQSNARSNPKPRLSPRPKLNVYLPFWGPFQGWSMPQFWEFLGIWRPNYGLYMRLLVLFFFFIIL